MLLDTIYQVNRKFAGFTADTFIAGSALGSCRDNLCFVAASAEFLI